MGLRTSPKTFERSERIAPLGNKTWRIWIKEGTAVEEVVSRLRHECTVCLFVASARLRRKRIVRCVVRGKQWHAGNSAQPRVRSAETGILRAAREGNEGYAALVAHHASELPAAQHLVHRAALVQKLLAFANGQLV